MSNNRLPQGVICRFDGGRKEITRSDSGAGFPEIGDDLMREFARRLYFNYRNHIWECQRRGVELGSKLQEEEATT